MCSRQISVLFVLMRVEISLFSSGILGSCGVFLLVKFLCAILLRMGCGRSLYVFLSCLVRYVGECLVCVMYVPVCLPVVGISLSVLVYCVFVVSLYCY